MVYRFHLTYDETLDKLELKYIPTTTTGYTLPPVMYKIVHFNSISNFLFPKEVKVKITIDDIRLKSTLTTNITIKFTKKSFFYKILGFT